MLISHWTSLQKIARINAHSSVNENKMENFPGAKRASRNIRNINLN